MLTMIALMTLSAGGSQRETMQEAFASLSVLMRCRDQDCAPDDALVEALERIEKVGHAFDVKGHDGETQRLAMLLQDYARRTRLRVEAGDRRTLPQRVQTMATVCFGCHTREVVMRDFAPAEAVGTGRTALEQARWMAATRQFGPALDRYQQALISPPHPVAALDEALTILVRTKADGVRAAIFLAELAHADLPPALASRVADDRAAVKRWLHEADEDHAAKPSVVLAHARTLLATHERVPVLRAMGLLSALLDQKQPAVFRAEVLSLLADGAHDMPSQLLWDLQSLYLEACIRELPHSTLAQQCFNRLVTETTLGFTGSRGTEIPPEEAQRLEVLHRIAAVAQMKK